MACVYGLCVWVVCMAWVYDLCVCVPVARVCVHFVRCLGP